jgi:manganese oxidase
MSHRYGDGEPVEQIAAEFSVAEDAEDSGEMAMNYRSDPLWFRFGLPPNTPFTGPSSFRTVGNAGDAYSNGLAGGDPSAPVFTARAGTEARIHLLEPTGANRAGVMTLHGHVWQRTPYVCATSYLGIPGNCNPTGFYPTLSGTGIDANGATGLSAMGVASRKIGNYAPSIYMGAQDQIQPASHFTVWLPSVGGSNAVTGDYLLMDRSGFGSLAGTWGILRATP